MRRRADFAQCDSSGSQLFPVEEGGKLSGRCGAEVGIPDSIVCARAKDQPAENWWNTFCHLCHRSQDECAF